MQVGRVPLRKLRHRVHAGRFQQFRELASDTLDPEQISVVDPLQDQVLGDAIELKNIASKDESRLDKAKDAATALKDPGAPGNGPAAPQNKPN